LVLRPQGLKENTLEEKTRRKQKGVDYEEGASSKKKRGKRGNEHNSFRKVGN